MTNSLTFARQLDEQDPLKEFRSQFIVPKDIYFLGNSLGAQPKRTQQYIQDVLNQWGTHGVEAFFMGDQPWLQMHDQLTAPLAAIVGCLPQEVVVMNSLTVNLHLLMASFYRPDGKRTKILCEEKAFPSDQYMLETHVRHYGFNADEVIVEVAHGEILQAIEQYKDELALVMMGGLNYYTGQLFDMQPITKAGQAAGAKVGFDLAHAVGNIPLHLHDWNVDFAAWCSYKYLNSGPGAIGGVYIHERYHNQDTPRLAGWWGYDKATQFLMKKGFQPMNSAQGWQLSTPPPMLYAAHKASLEIFAEAGMDRLHAKRKQLNNWLWFLLDELDPVIEFITPRNEAERGCQVSMLMLQQGRVVYDKLTKAGIMVDWREPNVIRLAPVPLYNTYEEVWQFTNILQQILTKA